MMTWVEQLMNLDEALFLGIHAEGASPLLDPWMLAFRDAVSWVPLYVLVLGWIIKNRRSKALLFLLGTLLTFAITDYGSASILKPLIARERPCYNEELIPHLRNLIGCGGRWSMPSSHASNHFGMAAFWFFSLRSMGVRNWYWVWLWALVIGYAQIYVGKHYPLDIMAGALYGTVAGLLVAKIFNHYQKKPKFQRNRTTFDALP